MTNQLSKIKKDLGIGVCCPICGSGHSEVRDSRPAQNNIRRRRVCQVCEYKWTTYETNQIPNRKHVALAKRKLIRQLEEMLADLKSDGAKNTTADHTIG